eukprot:gene30532-2782_t
MRAKSSMHSVVDLNADVDSSASSKPSQRRRPSSRRPSRVDIAEAKFRRASEMHRSQLTRLGRASVKDWHRDLDPTKGSVDPLDTQSAVLCNPPLMTPVKPGDWLYLIYSPCPLPKNQDDVDDVLDDNEGLTFTDYRSQRNAAVGTMMGGGVSGKGSLQREGSMLGSSMSTSRIYNGTLPGRPSTNSAFSSTRRSAAERSDKDAARLRSGGGGTGGMTPTRSSAMSRAASPPGRAVSLSVTNLDERGGGDDSGGSGSKISAKLISRLREKAGRAREKKGGAMVSDNLLSQLHETVDRAGVKKGGDAMKRLRSLKSLSKMMKAAAIDEYPRADGAEFEEGLLEPELVASAMSHSQEIGESERESSDGGGGGSGGDGSARTEFDFEERKFLRNAEGIVNHG